MVVTCWLIKKQDQKRIWEIARRTCFRQVGGHPYFDIAVCAILSLNPKCKLECKQRPHSAIPHEMEHFSTELSDLEVNGLRLVFPPCCYKKQLQNSENMENRAKFKNLPIAYKHVKFLSKNLLGCCRFVIHIQNVDSVLTCRGSLFDCCWPIGCCRDRKCLWVNAL